MNADGLNVCVAVAPPGGDHRRRLHGGVRVASEERKAARQRDNTHGPRPAGRCPNLQDPPPTRATAETEDWNTQR